MRKAFDSNVPKFRPRLKGSASSEEPAAGEPSAGPIPAGGEAEAAAPGPASPLEEADGAVVEPAIPLALSVPGEEPAAGAPADVPPGAPPPPVVLPQRPEARLVHDEEATGAEPVPFDESPDVQARRERLMQVKRKVAAAARPVPAIPALPETPARAGESALALVRDLEAQLQRARDVETALRTDLDQARAELARGAAESRRTVERLDAMERQVEEKRAVLQEMLGEMNALEDERDGAVARAQALAALDEERQTLLDGLSTRAEEAERGRSEAQAEVERMESELDERAGEAARLRAALAQVTRERDELARDLSEARRERDELADARKALEQVHEALATARARLG